MMKKLLCMTALAGLSLTTFSMNASAQHYDGIWDKDRFQLRGRVIGIIADGDGNENVTGLATDVNHAVVPEFDVTYFITPNIAAELIAATANHKVSAGGQELGDTWILPPTLTVQYHFQPEEKFSPYVGAGINYSLFYGEDDTAPFSDLDVDGGFGFALQAGFDYWLNENWGFNMDVKYIDLQVDVDVNSGATALSADDVDLDPWVVGVGASYRF